MSITSKLFKFGLIKKGYEYYKNKKNGHKTRNVSGGARTGVDRSPS